MAPNGQGNPAGCIGFFFKEYARQVRGRFFCGNKRFHLRIQPTEFTYFWAGEFFIGGPWRYPFATGGYAGPCTQTRALRAGFMCRKSVSIHPFHRTERLGPHMQPARILDDPVVFSGADRTTTALCVPIPMCKLQMRQHSQWRETVVTGDRGPRRGIRVHTPDGGGPGNRR